MNRTRSPRQPTHKRIAASEQLQRAGCVFESRPVECFTGGASRTQALEGWWAGRVYLAPTATVALKVFKG